MSNTDLKSLLNDPSLLAEKAYVGGAWIEGDGGTYKVTSPDGAELRRLTGRVSELTERDGGLRLEVTDPNPPADYAGAPAIRPITISSGTPKVGGHTDASRIPRLPHVPAPK